MGNYTSADLDAALQVVSSAISRCEKAWPKFAPGTSQHTLLNNRIKALTIAKFLLTRDAGISGYTKEELTDALRPVSSIIGKCETAQKKYAQGTPQYKRFDGMIRAMSVSKSIIEEEIAKRGCVLHQP